MIDSFHSSAFLFWSITTLRSLRRVSCYVGAFIVDGVVLVALWNLRVLGDKLAGIL